MRRGKAFKRLRWLPLLLAGLIGFLLGDWHATTSRPADFSVSQNIALRFPEPESGSTAVPQAPDSRVATAMVLREGQVALLSPEPMVPPRPRQPAVSPEAAKVLPALPARQRPGDPKAAVASSRTVDHPGTLLNDAQIASVKARLHLTPDQEAMWPAVEAALRNVAYARAREAHRHGALAAQVASAEPDGIAVQGLKSAAIPLIMSFTDEQKNEVRNLAHVMGLDKLASEL